MGKTLIAPPHPLTRQQYWSFPHPACTAYAITVTTQQLHCTHVHTFKVKSYTDAEATCTCTCIVCLLLLTSALFKLHSASHCVHNTLGLFKNFLQHKMAVVTYMYEHDHLSAIPKLIYTYKYTYVHMYLTLCAGTWTCTFQTACNYHHNIFPLLHAHRKNWLVFKAPISV